MFPGGGGSGGAGREDNKILGAGVPAGLAGKVYLSFTPGYLGHSLTSAWISSLLMGSVCCSFSGLDPSSS